MPRIAHVSDIHMLEVRPSGSRSYGFDVRVLSFGRRLDAEARARKLRAAIALAVHERADHVVISGDLTESGRPAQFERLAEVLSETGLSPSRLTLVPGNHDSYGLPRSFAHALEGPLRPYRETSATDAGKVVDIGGAFLLPIDATFQQQIPRSAGLIDRESVAAIGWRAADPALQKKPTLLVMHHPPLPRRTRAWDWVDGLVGHEGVLEILRGAPGIDVLHGHMHFASDHEVPRDLARRGQTRIYGAPAVVDDAVDGPRVRLYDVGLDVVRAPRLAA